MPNRPLTTEDIIKEHIKKFKIAHFCGVFSWDSLPKKPFRTKFTIINLDKFSGKQSHWVAYYKYKCNVEYFDSFGDLLPSLEIQ